ncbi:uncharacterized protein LOC106137502 isoform X2 [Amyelois transitella]|uniref:uncharacterized protein LOC106137502 isoform X2 n=1 Tax=Amyelois transitella TaxID=680683 RepID=UPI00299032DE|nr:uncharacterized protein LOC106137502 isoform X2 [Amyelois transitella]
MHKDYGNYKMYNMMALIVSYKNLFIPEYSTNKMTGLRRICAIKYWLRKPTKHRNLQIMFCLFVLLCISMIVYKLAFETHDGDLEYQLIYKRAERILAEQLRRDKGRGCVMPKLDPFGKEATIYDSDPTKIVCPGIGWVKCYLSECKVVEEILNNYTSVVCVYRDIIFEAELKSSYGDPISVVDANVYHLNISDHVEVSCSGIEKRLLYSSTWFGYQAGFRSSVHLNQAPIGRENSINILIFTFDSSAKIGFIRRMPKSFKYLTEEIHAIVLNSYNIVGDGTREALTPLLSGKNLFELPNTRSDSGNKTCDSYPFIFYKLRDDGYRTAYFEDGPGKGAFQWDLNGFRHQPVHHYLSAYLDHSGRYYKDYCLDDTPQFKVMMNLTYQFMQLSGKKFIFTIVGDISHDNYSVITAADDDFVEFLKTFKHEGHLHNTMLIVMGDHGPRFGVDRERPQARLEERLPLMSIVLPETLKTRRPTALSALQYNVNSLTTPYDIHATLLDALDLRKYWNMYKIPGADHLRGMTLLEPIPQNRSCTEAGVGPHWCACAVWYEISQRDHMFKLASEALVDYINDLTEPARSQCSFRTISKVHWVKTQYIEDDELLQFLKNLKHQLYQVKATLNPGASNFEATLTFSVDAMEFIVTSKDISRTNKYKGESDCISRTHPRLLPYCYCKQ